MPGLLEDLETAAAWLASALQQSGYAADGTPESLHEVERFFREQRRPGGLLDEDVGRRLFAIGAYVGEVVRGARGGRWIVNDADPHGEIDVALDLGDGTLVFPVRRAMTRLTRGEGESFVELGRDVGVLE